MYLKATMLTSLPGLIVMNSTVLKNIWGNNPNRLTWLSSLTFIKPQIILSLCGINIYTEIYTEACDSNKYKQYILQINKAKYINKLNWYTDSKKNHSARFSSRMIVITKCCLWSVPLGWWSYCRFSILSKNSTLLQHKLPNEFVQAGHFTL